MLLVEDNPINQQLAVELMESRRVKVDVANNGQEAIERINAHRPTYYSVVLMDLQMPVMDGYEATRLLRLDSRYVKLPIVAMTAHAMADERERCLVLGMNGHVSKPIDPEMLYATLAEFNDARRCRASRTDDVARGARRTDVDARRSRAAGDRRPRCPLRIAPRRRQGRVLFAVAATVRPRLRRICQVRRVHAADRRHGKTRRDRPIR